MPKKKKKWMSEGRKTQVILLDDRRLDLLVQPKLYSTELLDIVASHFNLKEKEYFGLSFKDETFFIESIGYLKDNATIELFYLQAKQSIFKGYVEVDSETVFELAAHVLQASFGDYIE
ncbi:hypothetical protein LSH36_85g07064 [Paralvinella palmiformis]|uniref:FERM domain-containing protein n=1 Tax=Paralvinella palmiformis TaxID=53620 RepID=A0AAD9NC41_9ANNE|nr:hypothetical protein LSH36_85g07064 [Paralvinella palmiformis]